MKYLIKINKDIRDRIKIYKDDKLIYIGKKEGAAASFFDGFIGSAYSKGAKFVIYKDGFEYLTIERNFYDEIKKYILKFREEEIGFIESFVQGDIINFDIGYKEEEWKFLINTDAEELEIYDIGKIFPKKQRFTVYQEAEVQIIDEDYERVIFALAIYIWDVFVKYKKAFIVR